MEKQVASRQWWSWQSGSLAEVGLPKEKAHVLSCSPHHGMGGGGKGQRLEEAGPGPFSVCVYILRALQMDFFCDLTYFL